MPEKKAPSKKATPKADSKPKTTKAADAPKVTANKVEASKLKVPVESFYGTGRRKQAIAKVWLFKGSGTVEINGQTLKGFFGIDRLVTAVLRPLSALNLNGKYDVKISTIGGGLVGQADASQLGVARAILEMNEEFRKSLRSEGLLTRDARVKERKKYGRKKARKGYQYRKR